MHADNGNDRNTMTVVDYAIARLAKAGVKDIFGIPGDFAFPWGDAVAKNKDMNWRGVSNELNGSYAADGYARVNGIAALATTYAVGEMSALAGMMGAKAEKVPVIHLVGMPSMRLQKQPHKILHHTLGDGVYQNFINIGAQSACAHAILTPENCRYEMERVISTCLAESEPGYIIVAQDYADMPVTGPEVPEYGPRQSDPAELAAAVEAAAEKISAANSGCIMPSFKAARLHCQAELQALIEATALPFATVGLDKAVISESHPQYIGGYAGGFAAPHVREAVEQSDVLISAGGVLFNDFSTVGFYDSLIDPDKIIRIDMDYTQIGDRVYTNVQLRDVLRELTKKVKKFDVAEYKNPELSEVTGEAGDKITQATLMPRYERFFKPNDIIIADCGCSSVGMGGLKLPEGAEWHNGILWSTIGYATPASMGTCLADPSRRTVIVTGDGAHQLTANELGNFYRHGAKPIMFVVNNSGYAIERVLEEYPDYEYNDLAQWDYHKLPAALGCKDWFTAKVTTLGELDAAMATASEADTACYIEVVMDKHDYPKAAQAMGTRWEELYGVAERPGQPPK
jgi:indolepyruvate decarboxylase